MADDLARFDRLAGRPVAELVRAGADRAADPETAILRLERVLVASGKPAWLLEGLLETPDALPRALAVLGASGPAADLLVHQPELATLFALPHGGPLKTGELDREAARVMAAATSYRHGLDRLRSLRQRWLLRTLDADLSGARPQPEIWRDLSRAADALIRAAGAWVARDMGLPGIPVAIVAFGKLGGEELNYASDVDLVYVLPDEADETAERAAVRFCTALGRALEERMGRGSVTRVDLRLRPFGSQGAIVRRIAAVRAYYAHHAEPWERLALVRSRAVVEPFDAGWDQLREERAFLAPLSEATLAGMTALRDRLGEVAEGDDLKRAPGSIRDVELATQILQLVHGRERESLRGRPTPAALDALAREGLLPLEKAASLTDAYVFLRKLEHRVQMTDERQTHAFPADPAARDRLARLMGEPSGESLTEKLADVRRTVLRETASLLGERDDPRARVLAQAGKGLAPWIDGLGDPAYWRRLDENEGSLRRAARLVETAPRLLPLDPGRADRVLSGEIEEPGPPSYPDALVREALLGGDFSGPLAEALDRLMEERAQGRIAVVPLGSYGLGTMGPNSDIDALFLVPEHQDSAAAERRAEEMLTAARRDGGPAIDLRLRPDGGKGALARTLRALRQYDEEGMETWERLALGSARFLKPWPEAEKALRQAADRYPPTADLKAMKLRIERERSGGERDLKLGPGGLDDLFWGVRLREMRLGPEAPRPIALAERLPPYLRPVLARLVKARARAFLLGAERDILPEAPMFDALYPPDLRRPDAAAARAFLTEAW